MQKENQQYKIAPADRLASVSEYYFSRKLKEVARMNTEGKNVISLGIGKPRHAAIRRNHQGAVRERPKARRTWLSAYSRHSGTPASHVGMV